MLRCDRKQQNSVKQFSSVKNNKFKKDDKNSILIYMKYIRKNILWISIIEILERKSFPNSIQRCTMLNKSVPIVKR